MSISPKALLPAVVLLIFLFLINNNMQLQQSYAASKQGRIPKASSSKRNPWADKTFLEIGLEAGTDKIDPNGYQCIYEDLLAPYRHIPKLKILEIGLGCNMAYGPGKSYTLWTHYFSSVQTYFLEFDQKCGEKWAASLQSNKWQKKPIMTFGDQANRDLLKELAATHGPWDIIVDDGGHFTSQQIASFQELSPYIKPGGTYFIEDMSGSLNPGYGGTADGLSNGQVNTTLTMMAGVFAKSIQSYYAGTGYSLDRLVCCAQVCAFRRPVDKK